MLRDVAKRGFCEVARDISRHLGSEIDGLVNDSNRASDAFPSDLDMLKRSADKYLK